MDPVAITLGPLEIRWYAVCILLGLMLGVYLAVKEAPRKKILQDDIMDFILIAFPLSIIGARIYYVAFSWSDYKDNILSVFAIWNGGIAIYGGLITGAIILYFFTQYRFIKTLDFLDVVAPSVMLAQAIGRWGNFFNQEAYGPVTTLAYLEQEMIPQFIINGMKILGEYHIPTFYYESLWNINGFIILLLVRNCKKIKNGQLTGIYLIWYSLGRFYVESLRMDSLMLKNFKMAQLVSVVLLIIGLFLLLKDKILKKDTPNLYHDINTTKIGGDDEYNTL